MEFHIYINGDETYATCLGTVGIARRNGEPYDLFKGIKVAILRWGLTPNPLEKIKRYLMLNEPDFAVQVDGDEYTDLVMAAAKASGACRALYGCNQYWKIVDNASKGLSITMPAEDLNYDIDAEIDLASKFTVRHRDNEIADLQHTYEVQRKEIEALHEASMGKSATINDLQSKYARLSQFVVKTLISNPKALELVVGRQMTEGVDEHIRNNHPIEAIKLLRADGFNVSLREAKDIVDARTEYIGSKMPYDILMENIGGWFRILGEENTLKIDRLIVDGEKISALKELRAQTGCSLLDAKRLVEEREPISRNLV